MAAEIKNLYKSGSSKNPPPRVSSNSNTDKLEMSESEPMRMEELVAAETTTATRKCCYPSCGAEIPLNWEFALCDKCRALASRNSIALLLDPVAPRVIQRSEEIQRMLLENLTKEEILRYATRVEEHYLAVQVVIKKYGIAESKRNKPLTSITEQIQKARAENAHGSIKAKQGKKAASIRETKSQKLQKLLGIDEKMVKKLMEEDFDL